ncbi:hypothetical protein PUN28_011000 [Cardiocondyla obscurior]|uniref:Uncharacterized protein n=1 Tax=Cardiocondyla obscurior TaxID=286306 RepID=A0AAW2FM24_9HYME
MIGVLMPFKTMGSFNEMLTSLKLNVPGHSATHYIWTDARCVPGTSPPAKYTRANPSEMKFQASHSVSETICTSVWWETAPLSFYSICINIRAYKYRRVYWRHCTAFVKCAVKSGLPRSALPCKATSTWLQKYRQHFSLPIHFLYGIMSAVALHGRTRKHRSHRNLTRAQKNLYRILNSEYIAMLVNQLSSRPSSGRQIIRRLVRATCVSPG